MARRAADLREHVTVDRVRTDQADCLVAATVEAARKRVTVREILKRVRAVRNVQLPRGSVAAARKEMSAETEATIHLRNANTNSGIHRA